MGELGCCNYCGSTAILNYPEEATQEVKDKMATETCECSKSSIVREKEEEIRRAKERIMQLFGDESREMDFEPIPDQEIHNLMDNIVELVSNNLIRGVTITINSTTKAKISISSKGKINIERAQAIRYKLEA